MENESDRIASLIPVVRGLTSPENPWVRLVKKESFLFLFGAKQPDYWKHAFDQGDAKRRERCFLAMTGREAYFIGWIGIWGGRAWCGRERGCIHALFTRRSSSRWAGRYGEAKEEKSPHERTNIIKKCETRCAAWISSHDLGHTHLLMICNWTQKLYNKIWICMSTLSVCLCADSVRHPFWFPGGDNVKRLCITNHFVFLLVADGYRRFCC